MFQKSLSIILLLGMLAGCTGRSAQTPIPTVPAAIPTSRLPILNTEPLPIGDGGLISDQPCASPCFFEIRIGETQLAEVAPILEKSGISPCYEFNESAVTCGKGVFTIFVGADPATFTVDGIMYYPSIPVSIGDVIKKYGEPARAWVQSEGTPEDPYMSMFLLWDSIKMSINFPDDYDASNIGKQAYTIESELEIWSVSFMSDSGFYNLFSNIHAKLWNGYGDYVP
jgi:hypothetical protein